MELIIGVACQGYGLVDPWLDGALRFGGGYSNWLPAKNDDMTAVLNLVKGYSSAVAKINAASGSPATCVFVPPRQMGDGCGYVAPRKKGVGERNCIVESNRDGKVQNDVADMLGYALACLGGGVLLEGGCHVRVQIAGFCNLKEQQ